MTSEPGTTPRYGLLPSQIEMLARGIANERVRLDNSGRKHVQAWDVRRWLTRIFGYAGWSTRETSLVCVAERPGQNQHGGATVTVIYRCSIVLEVRDIYGNVMGEYHGSAAGEAPNFPAHMQADAHDFALKTADSQALKRAAVNLGDQFGLSLYNAGTLAPVVNASVAYGPLTPAEPLANDVGVPEDEAAEAARQIALQEAAAEQTGRGEQRQRSDDRPRQAPPAAAGSLYGPTSAPMTREQMQLASVGANTAIPRKGPDAGPRPQAATPNGRARAIVWDVDDVLRNLDDCGEALEAIHNIRQKAIKSNLGNDVVRVPDRLLDEHAVDKQGIPFSVTSYVHEIIDAAGLLVRALCEASQPYGDNRVSHSDLVYAATHGPDQVSDAAMDELDRRVNTRDRGEDYGGRDRDEREATY